jgi:AraC-like DNA-binding protein
MASKPDRFTPLHFSTVEAPGRRAPTCEEITVHSVSRRRVSLFERSYRTNTRIWNLPAGDRGASAHTRVQSMVLSCGMSAQRTRELIADGNDDIVLQIHQAGERIVSQCGREAIVKPGGGVFISNADTSAVILPGPSRSVGIALPRRLMTALCPGLEDTLARPLLPDGAVLRLLVRYLQVLEDETALARPDVRQAVVNHIHDLCALAVGATREATEVAKGRGVRAARLHAITADIARNLEGDVSVTALAGRHKMTPRYIQKLFEGEGSTLSRFVLGQRLARVHRRLTDPRYADMTVAAIVYASGFHDISTFNRDFRRQFGMTPTDVRATGRC